MEGVYYVDVDVGSPMQRASLIVDTASWMTAFACSGCRTCGRHLEPPFDPERSRSATWIPCGPSCGGTCQKGHCVYHMSYLDGSGIAGRWFRDTLRLLGGGSSADRWRQGGMFGVQTPLGCSGKESGLFRTQRPAGILGLAPGDPQQPTVISVFLESRKHAGIKEPRTFSLCLRDMGGLLRIGGSKPEAEEVRWVPMRFAGPHSKYSADVNGVAVDGTWLPIKLGKAQLDSASTYTYFPKEAYKRVRRSIEDFCKRRGSCGGTTPPTSSGADGDCWRVAVGRSVPLHRFPKLTWTMKGGIEVSWQPKAYLLRQSAGLDRYCYAFAASDAAPDGSVVILGASWMVDRELTFDIGKQRLGISPASCPRVPAGADKAGAKASNGEEQRRRSGNQRRRRKSSDATDSTTPLAIVTPLSAVSALVESYQDDDLQSEREDLESDDLPSHQAREALGINATENVNTVLRPSPSLRRPLFAAANEESSAAGVNIVGETVKVVEEASDMGMGASWPARADGIGGGGLLLCLEGFALTAMALACARQRLARRLRNHCCKRRSIR